MTDLKEIKEYILDNYGISFEFEYEKPTNYEKYQELKYKKGKEEYSLDVGYAHHPEIDNAEYWSIYYNYMNYKERHGFGGTYIDEGNKIIDKIMNMWGFEKIKQTNIFDFINN